MPGSDEDSQSGLLQNIIENLSDGEPQLQQYGDVGVHVAHYTYAWNGQGYDSDGCVGECPLQLQGMLPGCHCSI